ncbi:hypothetical protein EXU57_23365 [Segetibacter sp. 3557_3]|uniref:hypothetical protein n=1 Tax=Segetibacter sp. 3557_3 TaxID=2547429 RepID=UPI0010584EEA|nr:hypothetical protein [Segetibacter sp. 3557_3]TDH18406.1 hypothetical protein EXU57_23365 [Segetibacter sp. 3557_3]
MQTQQPDQSSDVNPETGVKKFNLQSEDMANLEKALTAEEEEVLNRGEITNNDGSVIETLDTAFHDKPGYISDHSPAGSNRAEYYEARSDGQSDSDEEQEYLNKQRGKAE